MQIDQVAGRGACCVAQAQALDVEPLVLKGLDRAGQADLLNLPKGYHWCAALAAWRSIALRGSTAQYCCDKRALRPA